MIRKIIRTLRHKTTRGKLFDATLAYQALDEKYEEQVETIARQNGTIDALTAANDEQHDEIVKLRMQLKDEQKRTVRAAARVVQLTVDLDEQMKANGDLKRTIETQQNEAHAMFEKMSALPVRPTCPTDCAKHANAGPGGSVCRNCIRNPHAVDKYEGAAE